MNAYHSEDIERDGQAYRVEYHYDTDHGAPWEECDGHGVVSGWERREKAPGELILCSDRGAHRFYDFAESVKIARRDRWNSWDVLPTAQERGEELQRVVRLDYDYLRAWCNDQWHYMGIVVFPLTADGDELQSKSHSLWGIESDSDPAYLDEVTNDLVRECETDLETA